MFPEGVPAAWPPHTACDFKRPQAQLQVRIERLPQVPPGFLTSTRALLSQAHLGPISAALSGLPGRFLTA